MKITNTHWGQFMALLQHIHEVTGVEMDVGNLDNVLLKQSGGSFRPGQTMMATAIKNPDFQQRTSRVKMPLTGQAIGTPQNRKGGFSKPTLAVKIVDLRHSHEMPMLFAYDVFDNGRRVLQVMDALTLDDDWRKSMHEKTGMLTKELNGIFSVVPEYMLFVETLIRAFNCKDYTRTIRAKEAAIREINQLYN